MKCLYLVTRSLDPTGRGRARWMMRWKPALNAFAITFADRWSAAETYQKRSRQKHRERDNARWVSAADHYAALNREPQPA